MLTNFSWIEPGRVAGMGIPRGDDWAALAAEGIGAVLTLTEGGTPGDPAAAGFVSLHVPMVDFSTPALADLERCVSWIRKQIAAGRAVVVHCHAGVGRTGAVLAAWLVSTGMGADAAIARVRSLRPGSVETRGQADAVRRFGTEGGRDE